MPFCSGICLRDFKQENQKSGEHYAWCRVCLDYVAYGVGVSSAEAAKVDHEKTHPGGNSVLVSKIPSDQEICAYIARGQAIEMR